MKRGYYSKNVYNIEVISLVPVPTCEMYWCNSGTDAMGVNNHSLIGFKT